MGVTTPLIDQKIDVLFRATILRGKRKPVPWRSVAVAEFYLVDFAPLGWSLLCDTCRSGETGDRTRSVSNSLRCGLDRHF